jgi:hypothetical protein
VLTPLAEVVQSLNHAGLIPPGENYTPALYVLVSLPDRLPSLPDGFRKLPEGFWNLPEGFWKVPEGFWKLPEGYCPILKFAGLPPNLPR